MSTEPFRRKQHYFVCLIDELFTCFKVQAFAIEIQIVKKYFSEFFSVQNSLPKEAVECVI